MSLWQPDHFVRSRLTRRQREILTLITDGRQTWASPPSGATPGRRSCADHLRDDPRSDQDGDQLAADAEAHRRLEGRRLMIAPRSTLAKLVAPNAT